MVAIYPLICTQNTLSHIDYGIPLLARKSTDYRTSTGKYHELRPTNPQDFDCRCNVKFKPEQLKKDIALREENNTVYNVDFVEKGGNNSFLNKYSRAKINKDVTYMQTIQEKLFKDPAQIIKPKLSEMKDSYRYQYRYPEEQNVTLIPPQACICELQVHERGVQPSIHPENKGYSKLTDIYLTENQAKYVPYSQEQLEKAQEDFITFYNANGKHKGLKQELPGKPHGNKTIFDKRCVKWVPPIRHLPRRPIEDICLGSQSEYMGKYSAPQLSDYFPYLIENSELFDDSLPNAGPWQNLCVPGMYRTEYSHIGTGWPVRAVVDIQPAENKEELPPHPPCSIRVNTK